MTDYDSMSTAELNAELERLRDLLEEVTEEREMMIFGTTGLHRSVAHYIEKYAAELKKINGQIDTVTNLLEQVK